MPIVHVKADFSNSRAEELTDKIRRAREIPGRDYITPADIKKLEREGEL
jgi:hypothetical protein